jgi:hypothetical protein
VVQAIDHAHRVHCADEMRCRAARRVSTDQQTTDNQRLGLERIS